MTEKRIMRNTRQRQAILEELKKVRTHPTADELYDLVRKRIPNISLGTVYRNLDILADTGMILRLEQGAGSYRFDGNAMNHYHVRCVQCGRVDDVTDAPLQGIEEAIKGKCDYEIISHRLEYLGVCPICLKGGSKG